jgi:hypothetical protein
MSDPDGSSTPRARGESAWLAHRDAVEARNAAAKRAGKARHDEWERLREANRRANQAREERRFLATREQS